MSKKRSLSALGATLLAGVTLATMVAPAANAAPAAQPKFGEQEIQLVKKTGDFAYTAATLYSSKNTVIRETFTLESEAEKAAASIRVIPRTGDFFNLKTAKGDGSVCLGNNGSLDGFHDNVLAGVADCNSTFALWTQTTSGALKNAKGYYLSEKASGSPSFYFLLSKDEADATVWDDVHIGEKFSAAGSFSDTTSQRATVTGKGAANATITVKNTAGATVGSAKADANGDFSILVTAPNKGGVYSLNVTQTVDGTVSAPVKVDLDYGAAVAITNPADQADHATGTVRMSGTGTAGGAITVFDNGGGTPVGTGTVTASGTWSLTTSSLNDAEHKLEVKQLSKGNNTTTASVTLNPGSDGIVFTPLAVTSPQGYTAGQSKTITGKATPGATITISNETFSTAVGTVTANANGDWSYTRQYGPTAIYSLKFVQESAKGTDQITGYRLAPVTDTVNDITVTSDHVYAAGVNKTISGTATPGAEIVATNQWGTVVGKAKADNTSQGNWSFTRQYGPTASYTLTFTQTTLSGKTQSLGNWALNPSIVEAPLAITSDEDNDTYRPGVHTFAGTGTPSATITAKNQWGTNLGSATVNDKGTWTFERNLGPTSDYQITFTQTFNGKTATANLGLKAPVHAAFVLTSPAVGATYTPGVQTTFTGTTTPFATVNVVTDLGTPIAEVEADKKGNWSFKRSYGPTRTYTFNFTATDLDTTTDTLNGFVWAPTEAK